MYGELWSAWFCFISRLRIHNIYDVAYMNGCVSKRLKEELGRAMDKRFQLIINTILFKTVIPPII